MLQNNMQMRNYNTNNGEMAYGGGHSPPLSASNNYPPNRMATDAYGAPPVSKFKYVCSKLKRSSQ
jgi:hypothetical protein